MYPHFGQDPSTPFLQRVNRINHNPMKLGCSILKISGVSLNISPSLLEAENISHRRPRQKYSKTL